MNLIGPGPKQYFDYKYILLAYLLEGTTLYFDPLFESFVYRNDKKERSTLYFELGRRP